MWTWDIETTSWDRARCAVAISDAGDVVREVGPGCLERMSEHMDNVKSTYVGHYAGIFDTLLLSNVRERPWRKLTMSGSAILCAEDGSLRLRDSGRWFLNGLATIGKYLDFLDDEREARGEPRKRPKGGWLKKDVDRKRIEDLTDAESVAYCESDCEILAEGIKTAHAYMDERKARHAWTSGASALSLLEALEGGSWRLLDRFALDLPTAIAANVCIRGARVEPWKMGRADVVYVYDFKSAYPASYATRPIGIGARHLNADDAHVPGAVWRCRWSWPWRDRIPPVLDQETGAGYGWCSAWCVEEEIAAIEDAGIKVQRIEGWAPRKMVPIGQRFIAELYAEKERGSFHAKVALNSLHGKYSEAPIKECWRDSKPKEWYGPEPFVVGDYWRYLDVTLDKRGRVARHIQPLAAAQILGRARASLYERIKQVVDAGGDVYYCDTDSIHTNLSPDKMPGTLGKKLGDLAFEGGPYVGIYLGRKAYALLDPTTGEAQKGALKGVPWRGLKEGMASHEDVRGTPRLVFSEARGNVEGSDLRVETFKRAMESAAYVRKEGISTWIAGLKKGEGWKYKQVVRTIRPQPGAKVFDAKTGAWEYMSPAEKLLAPDRQAVLGQYETGAEDVLTAPEDVLTAPEDDT